MNDDTKSEIARLIRHMLEQKTEADQDAVYERIDKLSPDPEWSAYIFHSSEFYGETDQLDVQSVVEEIGDYKPTFL